MLAYCFKVFKYVILILRREKYILGRIGLYFGGIWGETVLILGICEARRNAFRDAENFIRDLGRSMHYFKEAREHRLPLGGLKKTLTHISLASFYGT